MKEYKIGEVFRHTDGKVYQCVEGRDCKRCAFGTGEYRCAKMNCGPWSRTIDGRMVVFTEAAEPVEGMLYRAKNGRMYRLKQGSHWGHRCACGTDPSLSCSALDSASFRSVLLGWYWAPVEEEEDAPAPVAPPPRTRHSHGGGRRGDVPDRRTDTSERRVQPAGQSR